MIAMLAIGKGAEQEILAQMKMLGANNVVVVNDGRLTITNGANARNSATRSARWPGWDTRSRL